MPAARNFDADSDHLSPKTRDLVPFHSVQPAKLKFSRRDIRCYF